MRLAIEEEAIEAACKSPIASGKWSAPSVSTSRRNLTVSGWLSGLFCPDRVTLKPGRPEAPPVAEPNLYNGTSGLLSVMWHREAAFESGTPCSYSCRVLSSSLSPRVTRAWLVHISVACLSMAAHSYSRNALPSGPDLSQGISLQLSRGSSVGRARHCDEGSASGGVVESRPALSLILLDRGLVP